MWPPNRPSSSNSAIPLKTFEDHNSRSFDDTPLTGAPSAGDLHDGDSTDVFVPVNMSSPAADLSPVSPMQNLHLGQLLGFHSSNGDRDARKLSVYVVLVGLCLSLIVLFIVSLVLVKRPPECESRARPTFLLIHEALVKQPPRNVILMISDGCGVASMTAARSFYQTLHDHPVDFKLPLDSLTAGLVRTRSSSSFVTDSAAGAIAYSCGVKTANEVVSMNSIGQPCASVLEQARQQGFYTGVVTTSRFSHATPAAFSAHIMDRRKESDISLQQLLGYGSLESPLHLLFGGGSSLLLPRNESGSFRNDDVNLEQKARERGWNIIKTRDGFDKLNSSVSLPILGVFAADHMSFELDRVPEEEPSLAEMTQTALRILSSHATAKDAPGILLLVEGARIDMAAHTNDPAAHVWDILAYNDAAQISKQFSSTHPGSIFISVSDHETGGMSLGKQLGGLYPEYLWNPGYLINVKASVEKVVSELNVNSTSDAEIIAELRDAFQNSLGLKETAPTDEAKLPTTHKTITGYTNIDLERIKDMWKNTTSPISKTTGSQVSYEISNLVSQSAHVGWSTHGHSGADVPLYVFAYDPTVRPPSKFEPLLKNSLLKDPVEWDAATAISSPSLSLKDQLKGNLENVEVGQWIAQYLSLDMRNATDRLLQQKPFDP